MPPDVELGLYVFVLSTLLGFQAIRRVPTLLHSPLMALTNAISGVALVGSLVIAGAERTALSTALGTAAVTASTINVVGGFMITVRMLRMFRSRRDPAAVPRPDRPGGTPAGPVRLVGGALGALAVLAVLAVALRRAVAGSATAGATATSLAYLLAATLFVLALAWLTDPRTVRRVVLAGELGMLLAAVGALARPEIVRVGWIAAGLAPFTQGALGLEVVLGFLTFTGSLMAFGKLQGLLPDRPVVYRGQTVVNVALLAAASGLAAWLLVAPGQLAVFAVMSLLALVFGALLIVPIGGADMPTVISLLNSYAGLSGAAMGFVLRDSVLIVVGALDGASGLLLSILMCRAMNRSFTNVPSGAFGRGGAAGIAAAGRPVRTGTPDEAARLLDTARSVIIVPGYGMAVAQAQHRVRELSVLLARRGVDVRFAIHPVAGRMPGHMNVLLAEASIPYEQLHDMDAINADFDQCDVALVLGANDVVNPAARHDPASPLHGMPILNADRARAIVVVKRSLGPGFAGVDNELFHDPRTLMLLGDARDVVGQVIDELARLGAPA